MASKSRSLSSKGKRISSPAKPVSLSLQATCSLCSKFFDDPRILPCLHSFCFKCLTNKMKGCPTCKKAFQLPEGGLSALPKDLRKQYEVEVAEYEAKITNSSEIACDRCLDSSESTATTFCCNCCKFLCYKCQQDHKRHREKYQHELVNVGNKVSTKSLAESIPHKKALCQIHSDEVLKFFCNTCNQLVCRDCIILKHNDHKYDRVEQVVEDGKKKLRSLVSEASSFADKLERSASDGEKMIKKIQLKKTSTDDLIRSEFQKLHAALNAREKSLLARNTEIHFEKETALKLQQESMNVLQQNIRQFVGKIKEALTVYNPVELLSAQTSMSAGLMDIQKECGSFSLELCKNDLLTTSFATSSMLTDFEDFGIITASCCAGNSTVFLKTSELIQGEKKLLLVTARNEKGELYKKGGENVVASLSTLVSQKLEKFTGVDNKDGTYTITINPQKTGEHSLDIRIVNEAIKFSPFLVYVRSKRNYNNLCHQLNISTSNYPHDVAVSGNKVFIVNNGDIIVASTSNGSIQNSITCQSEYGKVGCNSFGIAAHENILYISDEPNKCVHKLTTSGKYLAKIGSSGSGEGSLQTPRGLCVSVDGELYVTELNANRISVFKTDGTFIRHISGSLNQPWGIAISPIGQLHVANHAGNCISVHSNEGQFIREYGRGSCTYPIGVAVSAEGFSFVTECQTQQYYSEQLQRRRYCEILVQYSGVTVFDQHFNLICTMPQNPAYEQQQDMIKYPKYGQNPAYGQQQNMIYQGYGLTCDRDGFIYACDYQSRRVLKF